MNRGLKDVLRGLAVASAKSRAPARLHSSTNSGRPHVPREREGAEVALCDVGAESLRYPNFC